MDEPRTLTREEILYLDMTEAREDIAEYLGITRGDLDDILNGEKYKARQYFSYAVSTGRIKRLPCSICGNPKSQGHHPDYSKPLEVIWLCKKHHMELHKKLKRETMVRIINLIETT